MDAITCIIAQSVIFLVYTLFIYFKYGVLNSISDSYYALPEKTNILFTLFIWGIAIPLAFLGNYADAFFIAAGFLMFVGAATQFRSDDAYTPKIHNIGATGGIVCSLLGLVILKIYFPLVIAIIGSIILTKKLSMERNRIWWVEIFCFACIEAGLYYLVLTNPKTFS